MRTGISLIAALLLLSCGDPSETKDHSGDTSVEPISNLAEPKPEFDQSMAFEVLSFGLNKENPDVQADTAECLKWTLTKANVFELLSSLPPIPRSDWHDRFEHLPCEIAGDFVQNGDTFSFGINGGSSITVGIADTFYFYGDMKSRYDSLFLYPALEQGHPQ
jgi:hypothetical protein